MNFELAEFLNSHENWEELLRAAPYELIIHNDGDYYIFKYNQYASDMSLPICQQARGIIFFRHANGVMQCVCRAMDKFFNYGEVNAAQINWSNLLRVNEKMDGNLIKIWFHLGWHMSTNGTIDAFNCFYENAKSFGDIFLETVNCTSLEDFCEGMNLRYTYYFELINYQTKVAIDYAENAIYYLGERNMDSGLEGYQQILYKNWHNVRWPQSFHLNDLGSCLRQVQAWDNSHEGLVVCDMDFNRIKIKGEAYLELFHMRDNAPCTVSRVMEMYRDDTLDDYLAYNPNRREQVEQYLNRYELICLRFGEARNLAVDLHWFELPRNKFAQKVHEYKRPFGAYLFKVYDNHNLGSDEYLRSIPLKRVCDLINSWE